MTKSKALSMIAAIDLAPTRAAIESAEQELAQLRAAQSSAEKQIDAFSRRAREAESNGVDGDSVANAILTGEAVPSADSTAIREQIQALRAGVSALRDRQEAQQRIIERTRQDLSKAIGAAIGQSTDEFEPVARAAVQSLCDAHATLDALVQSGAVVSLAETRRQLAGAIGGIQYSPIGVDVQGRVSADAMELLRAAQPAIELAGKSMPNAETVPASKRFFGRFRAA